MNEKDLKKAADYIKPDAEAEERILNKALLFNRGREKKIMLNKKGFAVAAAIVVLAATGIYGSGTFKSVWYCHSSSAPDYTETPAAQRLQKDVGFTPTLVEKFENGYAFKSANIVEGAIVDEDENGKNISREKTKSINITYSNGDNELTLDIQKKPLHSLELGDEKISLIVESDELSDTVELYYEEYLNKCVPPDYELTEEDKKAEENGDVVISVGADEVFTQTVKGVTFELDGLLYSIITLDGDLTKDEFSEISGEIIKTYYAQKADNGAPQ